VVQGPKVRSGSCHGKGKEQRTNLHALTFAVPQSLPVVPCLLCLSPSLGPGSIGLFP
jgi:hypothetical protein